MTYELASAHAAAEAQRFYLWLQGLVPSLSAFTLTLEKRHDQHGNYC
jgi:hypothetical protein